MSLGSTGLYPLGLRVGQGWTKPQDSQEVGSAGLLGLLLSVVKDRDGGS